MSDTLTTEERVDRIERAVVELYERSCSSGSATFGWIDRSTLIELRDEIAAVR